MGTHNHPITPVKAEFEAVRKTKLYEKVAQQIRGLIRDGLLKPGDKLPPERELAETFQVSRSSLRDAIRSLEVMGLLEPRQGEGTIVLDLDASALVSPLSTMLRQKRELVGELLDFRKIIEPPLAARAAAHATPEELVYMEEILGRDSVEMIGFEEEAGGVDGGLHGMVLCAGWRSFSNASTLSQSGLAPCSNGHVPQCARGRTAS